MMMAGLDGCLSTAHFVWEKTSLKIAELKEDERDLGIVWLALLVNSEPSIIYVNDRKYLRGRRQRVMCSVS